MRDKPHSNQRLEWPGGIVPEWARPQQNGNKRRRGKHSGSGAGAAGGKRERLQKVMAQSGHGSRRNIEILIAQGHLTINGQVAKLGDSVGPSDKVKLDGRLLKLRFGEQVPRVLLYHKPEGEIVTRDDPEGRATVFEKLPKVQGGRWVSVGRLDLNTGGLLIFTTSGELANQLTHPRFEVEREYAVRLLGELSEEQKQKLLTGVEVDGESCKFDSIEERGGDGANRWYHVVLREGRNREVRKMCEAVGLTVSRLMRVRFGPVQLPGFLKRGMMREMAEPDVLELLAFAGVNESEEEEEEREEVDDNIGNVAHAGHQEPAELPEVDGNRDDYANAGERQPREADGNRHHPQRGPRAQGQGGPKPHSQGKRKRGRGHGHKQGQGQGNPQGQGRAQGQGYVQPQPLQAYVEGHAVVKREPQEQARGQGYAQGQGRAQGQGQGQQQQPGSGQGNKPGRNRRKNRHRNRGGGEQQPLSNANREPR